MSNYARLSRDRAERTGHKKFIIPNANPRFEIGTGYNSAAPNKAPQPATAMAVHPRASSGVQSAAGAAFDDLELEAKAEDDGWLDEGEDVVAVEDGGAAVEEKESVVLSMAQNFCARLSAVGTLVPQLAATQV
jgi:hypothetical protein